MWVIRMGELSKTVFSCGHFEKCEEDERLATFVVILYYRQPLTLVAMLRFLQSLLESCETTSFKQRTFPLKAAT